MNKFLKIAFLTPEYPHASTGASGGIGTSIKNLAEELVRQGHMARVLVYGQKSERVFEENGVTIQCISNVKFKGLSWYFTRKKLENIINQLYSEKQIDLVEAPDWTGITSFIQPRKCPVVIRLNGSDTYFCHLDHRPVKWWNKFHEKRALQKADKHIAVSQFTADLTNTLFETHIPFTIIPNSIDAKLFESNAIPTEANTILYFGTLIRKKGLLELPHIFNKVIERLPEAQLILVGRDSPDAISGNVSTWGMMQPLFSEPALKKTIYLGGVPYGEIKAHIQKATICVFPTFAEALPVSWLEAMAMQKAIVASEIGWGKEIVENGKSGCLVHPTAHQEYAESILNLLEDSINRNKIEKQARERILDCFDSHVVALKNIEFYKKIAHS